MTKPAASLRLLAPAEVGRRVRQPPLGRTKAIELMGRIGGWKDPEIGGWVIPERVLTEYLRRKTTCHVQPGDSTAFPSTDGAATGSATSETQQESAISAHSTSETMEAQQASAPQSPPTGKSKHALRLARMLEQAPRSRSAKRSQRSNAHRKSPS